MGGGWELKFKLDLQHFAIKKVKYIKKADGTTAETGIKEYSAGTGISIENGVISANIGPLYYHSLYVENDYRGLNQINRLVVPIINNDPTPISTYQQLRDFLISSNYTSYQSLQPATGLYLGGNDSPLSGIFYYSEGDSICGTQPTGYSAFTLTMTPETIVSMVDNVRRLL